MNARTNAPQFGLSVPPPIMRQPAEQQAFPDVRTAGIASNPGDARFSRLVTFGLAGGDAHIGVWPDDSIGSDDRLASGVQDLRKAIESLSAKGADLMTAPIGVVERDAKVKALAVASAKDTEQPAGKLIAAHEASTHLIETASALPAFDTLPNATVQVTLAMAHRLQAMTPQARGTAIQLCEHDPNASPWAEILVHLPPELTGVTPQQRDVVRRKLFEQRRPNEFKALRTSLEKLSIARQAISVTATQIHRHGALPGEFLSRAQSLSVLKWG